MLQNNIHYKFGTMTGKTPEYLMLVLLQVTNSLASGVSGGHRSSLGQVWDHVPHTRILLERDFIKASTSFSRKATIIKSARMVIQAFIFYYAHALNQKSKMLCDLAFKNILYEEDK